MSDTSGSVKGGLVSTDSIFTLTTVIIIAWLFLDRLIPEGLFLDGLIYASIARNLAEGTGTFWAPEYLGPFWGHPPLMPGLQSVFFEVFGDHYATEKIYSLLVWVLTVLLLVRTWRKVADTRLPLWPLLLIWGSFPIVVWAYPANLLDNTMALFTALAVLFLLQRQNYGIMVAVLCMFAATLTKGVQGLFPLTVPVFYHLVFKEGAFGKQVFRTLLLIAGIAICYFILLRYDPAESFIRKYIDVQLYQTLAGNTFQHAVFTDHLFILPNLMLQFIPALVLAIIVFVLFKLKREKISTDSASRRYAVFFLLIALSASLPIMVSAKQRTFYLVPAMFFYALSVAAWITPLINKLTKNLVLPRRLRYLIPVLLSAAFIIHFGFKLGHPGSLDEALIYDVRNILKYVPQNSRVVTCDALQRDYRLQAYLQRYGKVATEGFSWERQPFVITDAMQCESGFQDTLSAHNYAELWKGMRYSLYRLE